MATPFSFSSGLGSNDGSSGTGYSWNTSNPFNMPPSGGHRSVYNYPGSSTFGYGATGTLCIVCNIRPPFSRNGKSYPTCGLTCASRLKTRQSGSPWGSSQDGGANQGSQQSSSSSGGTQRTNFTPPQPVQPGMPVCVICKVRSTLQGYLTCGRSCVEKLCKEGGDPAVCDYCHARPRVAGQNQCGATCAAKAKNACLLCKCRPTTGKFHLCGKTCKTISTMKTPLILEAPKGHKTYTMVESLFQQAWKSGTAPIIKKIFKIIENDDFRRPYDAYLKATGNEKFRYHGTRRSCQLGVSTTELCADPGCRICNILKTSFKVSLANNGCFGAGIYSSSASNKAFGYGAASGAMLLNKVVLGKPYPTGLGTRSCPDGYNSVVYDEGGAANETIVYRDDAIRPVFLIMF
ncbi:hypothetical protein DFP72DRAFT_909489 [Ephemerocybe angulata]|uniref:PARP catalytic domain-containing protein n=1 Tax=Ephemerocybe angulata TaxID=980116 RepID=A0A8H6M472_9AGAR|nr:hypothetical protein DFP72DRAFT_909489 [Tulosesus angulatus]